MSSLQFLAFFSTHDSTCSNTFKKCLCYVKSRLLKTIFLVSIEAQASDIMTKFPYEIISLISSNTSTRLM